MNVRRSIVLTANLFDVKAAVDKTRIPVAVPVSMILLLSLSQISAVKAMFSSRQLHRDHGQKIQVRDHE
jgi:hypothetical protein